MSLRTFAQLLAGCSTLLTGAALGLWIRKAAIIYGIPRRIFIGLCVTALSTAIAAILLAVMLLLNPPLR